MIKLAEDVWKRRFAERLLVFFVARGTTAENARQDAYAHAQDEYAARKSGTPEQHAERLIAAIEGEQEKDALAGWAGERRH
jgi:hypothetical protein